MAGQEDYQLAVISTPAVPRVFSRQHGNRVLEQFTETDLGTNEVIVHQPQRLSVTPRDHMMAPYPSRARKMAPYPSRAPMMAPYTYPSTDRMRASYPGHQAYVDGSSYADDRETRTALCLFRVAFSTVAHIGFFVCIIGTILSYVVDSLAEHGWKFAIVAGLCYFVLWSETWCSRDFDYLQNMSVDELNEHLNYIQMQAPKINLVLWRQESGSPPTPARVNIKSSETFDYTRCRDISPMAVNLARSQATRVSFYTKYKFADETTMNAYNIYRTHLKDKNKEWDLSEIITLKDFKKKALVYTHLAYNHPCFHPCFYMWLSSFLLTWPFRWWFRSKTAHTNYTFVKEIGI